MPRRRYRLGPVSFLTVMALLLAMVGTGRPAPAAASMHAAGSSMAATAAATTAAASGPPTVTRVDSMVQVTPDATGRARIPYCPTTTPCAFATPPPAVVVTGRSPISGSAIPANLLAYNATTTHFTLVALNQSGTPITTAIQVYYHAATDLTANEEIRTVTVTTDSSGNATVGYANPRPTAPLAVVASGVSPTDGANVPVSLVVSNPTPSGFTVRSLKYSGAANGSTQITLSYYAAWAGRIDAGTGWVAANATSAVTTDASGYATVRFAQALPSAPSGIVATGVSPASGSFIAASLMVDTPTTTGFRVRVLQQNGSVVASTNVTLAYHAVSGATSLTNLTLAPPRLVRSNGAELRWAHAPGVTFGRYEVHRSTTWGFTPSASTRLTTTTDPNDGEWQDTTAAPSSSPTTPRTYYYKVVGDTTVSNQVTVTTPTAGNATLTLQPDAAEGKATYVVRDLVNPEPCYDWFNYGATGHMRVGTAAHGVSHRPLLAFDLRDIPVGAQVASATLDLWYAGKPGVPTSTSGREVDLHRVTRAWTEGTGTYPGQCNGSGAAWNETQGGVRWSNGGGDHDTTSADATTGLKNRDADGMDRFTVTSLVQEWASASAPNHGMLLKLRNEGTPSDNPHFDYYADDHPTASERPRLTVTYADASASAIPRVAVSAPAPGERVGGIVRLKAAAGDDRRVDRVEFFVDGGSVGSTTSAPFQLDWNTAAATKGGHKITAKATDDAGNQSPVSPEVQVTVDNTSGPTGTLTAPTANAVVSGTAVTLSASASPSGTGDTIKQVEFLVDGDRVGEPDTISPYSVAWNTLDTQVPAFDGSHQVQALITESSGLQLRTAPTNVTVSNVGASHKASFDLNAARPDDQDGDLEVVPELMANATQPAGSSAPDPYAPPTSGTRTLDSAPQSSPPALQLADAGESPESPAGTEGGWPVEDQPPGCQTTAYCPTVTITNTSTTTWQGANLSLWYRWYAPNGVLLYEGQAASSFPATLAPNASTDPLPITINPPYLPPGADLGRYRLRLDIYDSATGRWFAQGGNKPVDRPVVVRRKLDGALGLERYYQYEGDDVGAGMTTLTNVANGNMLLRWTPFFAPGRGLSTMVDLTYNSLEDHSQSPAGNNFSLSISGLTRLGHGLDIHPNKADEISGNANKWVAFTDGDGTPHRFVGITQNGSTTWQEPPGVNLYLRSIATNPTTRRWALTRPDNVTFYFDEEGFPTAVVDRNGNTLTFVLENTPPGEDPGGPKKRVTHVTDAGGRNFTIDYWSKDEAKKAHVRGKIQRIADHTGSALDFDYYDDGNLLRLTQRGGTKANGEFLADRSFTFTYTTSSGAMEAIGDPDSRANPDPKTANQSTRIFSVRDPRGNETTYTYYGPSDGAQLRWKLASRRDRIGNTPAKRGLNPNPYTTEFGYDVTGRITRVTTPPPFEPRRTTSYAYDTDGKVTRITNPLGEPTDVEWTADFKVSKVTEPKGVATPTVPNDFATSYTYNANGYLTSQTNQLGKTTSLAYLDLQVDAADAGMHLSLLSTVTKPKGVATTTVADDFQWRYIYNDPTVDPARNLDKVVEPKNRPTDTANPVTDYDFNLAGSAAPGTVAAIRDANGNPPTTFPAYDPSGQPTEIRDPLGNVTRFAYDADGLLRSIQDPNHAAETAPDERSYKTFLDYDSFHRLGRQSAPKSTSTARGQLIWSSAEFDDNDNVTRRVDPHYGSTTEDGQNGPVSTATFDEMDRPLVVANSDTSVDAQGERTRFTYDEGGRMLTQTGPKGVLSATTDDHTVRYSYDLLDRVRQQTAMGSDATDARITHFCYDLAGDLRSVTSPRANRTSVSCPGDGPLTGVGFTATFTYDAAHRLVSQRDPLGHEQRTAYDDNGNPERQEADIDPASGRIARATVEFNQRDLPIKTTQRFDGTTRDVVSRIEYDLNGNRSKLISPRAHDAAAGGTPTQYVTDLVYDAVNRPTRITLPFDSRDGTERQYVHHAYDPNGNLAWTSLPVTTATASSVQPSARTSMTYFDPGWIRTSKDPVNPKVAFDYTAQGWQAQRTPDRVGAPGTPDVNRRMTWAYFNDGQLKRRTDQGSQPSSYTYDANNNLLTALDAAGVTDPGDAPMATEASYTGFDEVAKVRHRRTGNDAAPWTFTDYTYDRNGNTEVRRENGEETTAGSQSKAPRRHELTYDEADWLTRQLDLGTDGTCNADDRRIDNQFWSTGWERKRDIYKANSACDWTRKQTTTWTHFDNGKLKTLQTVAVRNGADEVTESHQVGYIDAGIYVNGQRVSDRYVLKRAEGSTASTCVAASPCDAQWSYDARDRLVRHQQRATKETRYTLDEPAKLLGDTTIRAGNVTTENDGSQSLHRRYTANQLTDLTVGTATTPTAKYWYDPLGNLDCVTLAAGSQANCSPSEGAASANLVTDYAYDYLNRLASTRMYSGGATRTDKADYTYDALDRVTKEVEDHAGTGNDRTTNFTHQGLTNLVTEEKQAGGTAPKTKTFSYDAYGHRLAMSQVDSGSTPGTPEHFTYGHDVHGSVSQLLTETGTVKASYGYTAYGGSDAAGGDPQALTSGDTNAQAPINPYRYAGKRVDSGTAASTSTPAPGYDMGVRRFGPDTTQFLQADMFDSALGDLGLTLDPLTQNRYALAGGNPVGYVEIDGHAPVVDGGGGGSSSPNPSTSSGTTGSGTSGTQTGTAEYAKEYAIGVGLELWDTAQGTLHLGKLFVCGFAHRYAGKCSEQTYQEANAVFNPQGVSLLEQGKQLVAGSFASTQEELESGNEARAAGRGTVALGGLLGGRGIFRAGRAGAVSRGSAGVRAGAAGAAGGGGRAAAGGARGAGAGLPTMVIDANRMPNIARNIYAAIVEEGHKDVLTRGPSEAARRANRTAALRNFRGSGSPDEYPFASTEEGGQFARVAGVPWAEQQTQAGIISHFYLSKGVARGDKFRVVIDWGDLAL